VHVLLAILCIALTVTLWIRGGKGITGLSVAASVAFLISGCPAFFATVPRSSDESGLLWLFIIPGFVIPASLLFLTCIYSFFPLARQIRAYIPGDCRSETLFREESEV